MCDQERMTVQTVYVSDGITTAPLCFTHHSAAHAHTIRILVWHSERVGQCNAAVQLRRADAADSLTLAPTDIEQLGRERLHAAALCCMATLHPFLTHTRALHCQPCDVERIRVCCVAVLRAQCIAQHIVDKVTVCVTQLTAAQYSADALKQHG